jgi:predicted dehydrogenase
MRKVVKIGVIGVGAFSARQHLPNIARNKNTKIQAFCDINPEILKKRQREYNVDYITLNPDDIFNDPEIDMVLIGTRSKMHAPFILEAVKYNKHIYVEKPMTMTYEETARVMAAVRQSKINVGVGFNRRFAPSMLEAKRHFQSYKSGSANIYYRIVDDHRVRPHYIFDMADGGGHLLQEGCHIFDLLAWFLEAEPVEIYSTGLSETDNIVIVKFDDGSIASVICGGKGGLFYPKESMEVFCSNRTLVVDHFYEMRYDGPDGNFIKHFPLDPKNKIQLENQSMNEFYHKIFSARPTNDISGEHAANGIAVPMPDKGHNATMNEFVKALIAGNKFSIDATDGARATICALKAYESIKYNKPAAIAPEEYGIHGKNDERQESIIIEKKESRQIKQIEYA